MIVASLFHMELQPAEAQTGIIQSLRWMGHEASPQHILEGRRALALRRAAHSPASPEHRLSAGSAPGAPGLSLAGKRRSFRSFCLGLRKDYSDLIPEGFPHLGGDAPGREREEAGPCSGHAGPEAGEGLCPGPSRKALQFACQRRGRGNLLPCPPGCPRPPVNHMPPDRASSCRSRRSSRPKAPSPPPSARAARRRQRGEDRAPAARSGRAVAFPSRRSPQFQSRIFIFML